MKYVIDGYNLIHKIDHLRGARLRNQREGLIRLLESAQARDKRLKDLTVIFDGRVDVLAPRLNSTVKIIFSKGISADEKIKEMVESSSFARDIGVVSDDRQIKFYASSLGAKKFSVSEFLKILAKSSTAVECKSHTFKLDEQEAKKINQELKKVWLEE